MRAVRFTFHGMRNRNTIIITSEYPSTKELLELPMAANKSKENFVFKESNKDESVPSVFRRFWNTIAKKTTYRVHFDEDAIIRRSIEELNTISIADYKAEVASYRVGDIEDLSQREYIGSEDRDLIGHFSPQDLVEDLSEKTGLCYNSVHRMCSQAFQRPWHRGLL